MLAYSKYSEVYAVIVVIDVATQIYLIFYDNREFERIKLICSTLRQAWHNNVICLLPASLSVLGESHQLECCFAAVEQLA